MATKQYFNIGAGWTKSYNGKDYISCRANSEANEKGNVRLQAVNQNGETVDIESFAMYWNDEKKSENSPDVRFVFSIDVD